VHVSFPEGMVLCRLWQEHGLVVQKFCRALWYCCRGRKVQSCQRAVSAMDVDNVRCLPVPVPQACSVTVLVLAACALEGRNLELHLCLCPWLFL